METLEQKIARIRRIPSLINWARQNHARADKTRNNLQKLADSKISISLGAVYSLCAKLAYRQITYDEAWERALGYDGYPGKSATEILPVFNEYLTNRQIEAPSEFQGFQVPFPIGKSEDGKGTLYIPVRPTFVSIQAGRLVPVFLVGWVNSPLDVHQRRLIASIVRRSILTQQDFLGSDAEIVSFVRRKFGKERQLGVWKASQFPDYSDEELLAQFARYTNALRHVIEYLKDSAG